MTAGKKGEALIGGVLTLVDSASYPCGCQIENGLIDAGYRLKPSMTMFTISDAFFSVRFSLVDKASIRSDLFMRLLLVLNGLKDLRGVNVKGNCRESNENFRDICQKITT